MPTVSTIWRLREPFLLGLGQMTSFAFITVNMRAVASGNLPLALLTDAGLQTVAFFVIRRIAKGSDESSIVNWAGYTVGGLLGTCIGLWLS